jgi:hypothetical protein
VDVDEEVGPDGIGQAGPVAHVYVAVVEARHHDAYAELVAEEARQAKGDLEVDVFFDRTFGAFRAGEVAAVARVDADRIDDGRRRVGRYLLRGGGEFPLGGDGGFYVYFDRRFRRRFSRRCPGLAGFLTFYPRSFSRLFRA